MAGLIGVPCSDTGRFSAFSESLAGLRQPEGTQLRFAVSTWRHYARNQLVEWMFEEGADWLLMVDDDQAFAPDALERLLSHNVDIVAALCLRRSEPYGPFCFSEEKDGIYRTLDLAHCPPELTSVAAVGTGMMLIRRNVFETLPEPWFTITPNSGEDMLFCKEARRAGFEIYCDLGCPIGHLTTTSVLPVRTASGEWKVGMIVSGETRITRDLPDPDKLSA